MEGMNDRLRPDEMQLLAMALSHLEVERPGWGDMLHRFSSRLGIEPEIYQHFHALHVAHVLRPSEERDSIMQLRAAVESKNPMLWAMVREIVWPK